MRVVIDTNVLLISIPKNSPYRPIYQSLLDGEYTLIINNEILSEYIEILSRYTSPNVANNIAKLLLNLPNVERQEVYFNWKLIQADPDDNKFVDCALAGNAKYLVTEDKHYRILQTIDFPKITLIDADDFLQMLTK